MLTIFEVLYRHWDRILMSIICESLFSEAWRMKCTSKMQGRNVTIPTETLRNKQRKRVVSYVHNWFSVTNTTQYHTKYLQIQQLVDTTWITTWQRTSWNLPKTKRTMDEFFEVRFPREKMGGTCFSPSDVCFPFFWSTLVLGCFFSVLELSIFPLWWYNGVLLWRYFCLVTLKHPSKWWEAMISSTCTRSIGLCSGKLI